MNILVIGNGFDVAHGLPTSYSDFLYFTEFFTEYNNTQDITEHETRNKQFEKVSKERYINYFSNLYDREKIEYCSLIDNNAWFNHFYDVFEKRVAEGKKGWIDFEAEISDVIKELDRMRNIYNNKNVDNFKIFSPIIKTSYKIISKLYRPRDPFWSKVYSCQRLNKIKERLTNNLNRLTRCLELYLNDFLNINSCGKIPLFTDEINPDYVITFNYTDTYERLYMDKLSDKFYCGEKSKEEKIHYIHGKAKKEHTIENCDLVLGIEEYLEGDDRQKDNEYIEFKKFYQRIYKGTGSTYTNWLKKSKEISEEINVTIYGHSIATTDGDIIKKLIEAATTTTIYYYDKDALHNIILNLVQIIGEEELIERTSDDSEKGSIFFKSIT